MLAGSATFDKLRRENSAVPQISQLFVVWLCLFFSTSLLWEPDAGARQQAIPAMAIQNYDCTQTTI